MGIRNAVILGTIFFSLLFVELAIGQVRPQTLVPGKGNAVPVQQLKAPDAAADGAVAISSQVKAEETPEQKKVKLLLAAQFDRTTPAVLKARSDKPAKKKPEEESTKPDTAVVMNAFEGFAVLEFANETKFKIGQIVKLHFDDQDFGEWELLSISGKKVSAQITAKQETPAPEKKNTRGGKSKNQ